ncbi:MAG: hypothetical protein AB1725_08115 [Armatimonadota bacterium]
MEETLSTTCEAGRAFISSAKRREAATVEERRDETDLKNITVSELAEGYGNKAEEAVRGYGGRLNIRPACQREFIYKDRQHDEAMLFGHERACSNGL